MIQERRQSLLEKEERLKALERQLEEEELQLEYKYAQIINETPKISTDFSSTREKAGLSTILRSYDKNPYSIAGS